MIRLLHVFLQALLLSTVGKRSRSTALIQHLTKCVPKHHPNLVLQMSRDINTGEKGVVFFNHAGASPSPDSVVDRVVSHMRLEQRVGGYTAAEMVSDELQNVYQKLAELIGSKSTEDIALVESATVGWTRLFYSMANYQHRRKTSRKERVILISEAEYAANVVAACEWAKDHRQSMPTWTVLTLPSSLSAAGGSTGKVDLRVLEEILQGNYRYHHREKGVSALNPEDIAMVCVTHIPTNSGIVNDVEQIGSLISDYNRRQDYNEQQGSGPISIPSIFYLVDACQSVGHRALNVEEIRCHGLVGTGRKFLRGPRGTGFLYSPVSAILRPHHVDHFGVPVIRKSTLQPVEECIQVQPKTGAKRFEFYESNVANKLGLGEAVRYAIEDVGIDVIQACSLELAGALYARLQSVEQVQLHHPPDCGIVTFYVSNTDSSTVKQWLDGIFETSVVPSTSTPLDLSNVPDLVRVSLSYSNEIRELDALCEKLQCMSEDSD